MEGYFDNNKVEEKGILHINATNIDTFNRLINKAKEEADQLQQTINQLKNFNIEIEIDTNEGP